MMRKTTLRANPDKIRQWKQRSATGLRRNKSVNRRKPKRALEEAAYSIGHSPFLAAHPVCPVSGTATSQIHHSAKREGRWINLQRYWIAVSPEGHQWIEENKAEAERFGLMVRVRETASDHIAALEADGVSLHDPVFYKKWDGKPYFLDTGE